MSKVSSSVSSDNNELSNERHQFITEKLVDTPTLWVIVNMLRPSVILFWLNTNICERKHRQHGAPPAVDVQR